MDVSTSAPVRSQRSEVRGRTKHPASSILRSTWRALGFTEHGTRNTQYAIRNTRFASPLAFALATLCLLLPGCLRHEPPADLVIINGTEPESLDPAIIVGIP